MKSGSIGSGSIMLMVVTPVHLAQIVVASVFLKESRAASLPGEGGFSLRIRPHSDCFPEASSRSVLCPH